MDSISLLRLKLNMAHEIMEGTMMDVTNEQAHWMPTGTAHSVGASYAHCIMSEDMVISSVLRGQAPLCAGTWTNKLGLSEPMPMPNEEYGAKYPAWTKRVRVDMPALREYAQAVYANTDAWLASLTPDDLDKPMDLSIFGVGQSNLAYGLSVVMAHINNTAGEISAIKGCQGLKGYPF